MGQRKSVGLANLTGKILYTKHNSLLSPLDSAAGHAFGVLRESAILANKRAAKPETRFRVKKFDLKRSPFRTVVAKDTHQSDSW
jgi:hypothetical protein